MRAKICNLTRQLCDTFTQNLFKISLSDNSKLFKSASQIRTRDVLIRQSFNPETVAVNHYAAELFERRITVVLQRLSSMTRTCKQQLHWNLWQIQDASASEEPLETVGSTITWMLGRNSFTCVNFGFSVVSDDERKFEFKRKISATEKNKKL